MENAQSSSGQVTPKDLTRITDLELLKETPEEAVERSVDMNLHILLRNMNGAEPLLGDAIRFLAERAARSRKTLEVLEVGNGLPSAALLFQEDVIIGLGDFMIYGPGGPHDKPPVRSTVIANQDYVGAILTGQIKLDDSLDRYVISEYLNPVMGSPVQSRAHDQNAKNVILRAYEAKKNRGDIFLRTGASLTETLMKSFREGKRYDLIFSDLRPTIDRVNLIQAVQTSLSPEGYSFLPVRWWQPTFESGRKDQVLVDDTVSGPEGTTSLEDYLSRNFSEAFCIANYPGAKTLVLRGTKKPVHLPKFEAKVKEINNLTEDGVSINWNVK